MVYTRKDIDSLLRSSDKAVERGIIRLFQLQTDGEQRVAGTQLKNDVGFCCTDARSGTRFARFLLGMDDNNVIRFPKKSLTHPIARRIFSRYCKNGETPMGRARRITLKHSRQLTDLANR